MKLSVLRVQHLWHHNLECKIELCAKITIKAMKLKKNHPRNRGVRRSQILVWQIIKILKYWWGRKGSFYYRSEILIGQLLLCPPCS